MNARHLRTALSWSLLVTLAVSGIASPTALANGKYRYAVVATLGDPAPGGGTFAAPLEPGDLNARGEALFVAGLSTGGEGLFLQTSRGTVSLLRAGDPAPGGGVIHSFRHRVSLNERGDAAFTAQLDPVTSPVGANAGVYHYDARTGQVVAVLAPGVTPAPGGTVFTGSSGSAILNNRGEIVFAGIYPTSAGQTLPGLPALGAGIFVAGREGALTPVALPGEPAPGAGTFIDLGHPRINDRGDIGFYGHNAEKPCLPSSFPDTPSLFCGPPTGYVKWAKSGVIEPILRPGQVAPNGLGVFNGDSGNPILNNRGEIAFITATPPSAPGRPIFGIFVKQGESVRRIVGLGDPLPGGMHSGPFVGALDVTFDLNDRGDVAFLVSRTEGGHGIYRDSGGTVTQIAAAGQLLPGVGMVEDVIVGTEVGLESHGVRLSDRGEVLFRTKLSDGREALVTASRQIGPPGTIITVAGTGVSGFSGDGGPATLARMSQLDAADLDAKGNLFVANAGSGRIRKIDPQGIITTVAGGGKQIPRPGVEMAALDVSLPVLLGVVTDPGGNLFVVDAGLNCVMKVNPDGVLTVVAGGGTKGRIAADGGPAVEAALKLPVGLAVDIGGTLFIAEKDSNLVRKVTPDGFIHTVAGGGKPPAGSIGDGGSADQASLSQPVGVALDAQGNLYVSEANRHRIRKVDREGIITTVAGSGKPGFSGDGGPANEARINFPKNIRFDTAGNLYIGDRENRRIRRIDPNGIITTIAGGAALPKGSIGDGGSALDASLGHPFEAIPDAEGNLYIVDNEHSGPDIAVSPSNTNPGNRVRKVFGIAAPGLHAGAPFPAGSPSGPVEMTEGDLNFDGTVDVKDATLSLRMAVGSVVATELQRTVGDLNEDGAFDLRDVTLLLGRAVAR